MPFAKKVEPKADLIISIAGLKDNNHDVYLAVARKTDDFPRTLDMAKRFVLKPNGKNSVSVSISDLPYGKYAVTVFQDMNGNQKLDKGFLGIPDEPFAFSNNFHPLFGAPKWKDCEFDYSATSFTVRIDKLIKML